MAEIARGTSRPRSHYSNSGTSNHTSALFRDENHVVGSPSSISRLKSHRQYKYDDYDDDDEGASLLSFQKIKDERDYDLRSYTRKRSNNQRTTSLVRTSSPDRGGGGGGRHYDDKYHAYNDKRYSKNYDNDAMRQSGSRQSRSHESSASISYIDYNDSFHDNRNYSFHDNKNYSFHDNKRRSNDTKKYSDGRTRSQSPSITGDRRVGSTVRTDIHAGSTAASSITFDYYGFNQSQYRQRQRQQQQQPFVGHDGKLVEHTKYRTDDDYSTVSKPQVPVDITVPSPNKFLQKTSLNMNDHNYNGRELKKPPYSSSVKVHEMGSRRQLSNRRSSSKSRASSRNMDRKGSRSSSRGSSASKRSRSSDEKRSSSSRSTQSRSSKDSSKSGSRRSKESSKNDSGSRNSRSKSRSGNSSDKSKHRSRGRDLKKESSTRYLVSNDDTDQRSSKSGTSEKERRQIDRRREMMTGRATKHLLEDDKSIYSRSSVRYDVDDEGYCMHHPEIELMRLRSDGFWSTVRKKCPECIYEDCPSLMGDIDDDEDCAKESTSTPASSDITAEARAILSSARLFSFHDIVSPEDIEKEEELRRLKRRLAARAYHFPGNSWWADWMQYLSNTHTVLGLFFHHPLHPLKLQERLVILFGSIAIGLTISNMTYLYFIHNDYGADEVVFTLNSRHSKYTGLPEISVTKVMLTLWTLGSFLHTVFDLSLWHMKACTICRYGGLVDEKLARMGRLVGLFIVLVVMGVGGYAVLLRATLEYKGEGSVSEEVEESIKNNEIYDLDVEDKRSFKFLLGYLVEFVLALFVYYPIAVTVLFSGVLGCNGRVPLLGGRPREMKKELLHLQKKNESKILRTQNSAGSEKVNGNTNDVASNGSADSFDYFDEDQVI